MKYNFALWIRVTSICIIFNISDVSLSFCPEWQGNKVSLTKICGSSTHEKNAIMTVMVVAKVRAEHHKWFERQIGKNMRGKFP